MHKRCLKLPSHHQRPWKLLSRCHPGASAQRPGRADGTRPPGLLCHVVLLPCAGVPPLSVISHDISFRTPVSRDLLATALVSRLQAPTRLISLASALRCHPDRCGSAIPNLGRCPVSRRGRFRYCVCLAVGSAVRVWHTPTLLRGFPGKRFQRPSGTARQLQRLPIHHRITHSRMLPLGVAITRLSYPSTPDFSGCQIFQVSPRTPAPFLTPQKPTCRARSAVSRLLPRAGLIPAFTATRYAPVTRAPVSLSPNLPCSRRIESKGGVAPPSARFSRTSPIRGMRLNRAGDPWRGLPWSIRSWRLHHGGLAGPPAAWQRGLAGPDVTGLAYRVFRLRGISLF